LSKIKHAVKNVRLIVLFAMIVFSIIVIQPDPDPQGVAIRTVVQNSSAAIAGMVSPRATDKPMFREVITQINNRAVDDIDEFNEIMSELTPDDIVKIKTRTNFAYSGDKRSFSLFKQDTEYVLTVLPLYRVTVLNETEEVLVERKVPTNISINGTEFTINKTMNVTETRNKIRKDVIGTEDIGLKVFNAPSTNIRKGLDLQGGTRVLLAPETTVSDDDLDLIIDNLKERLNVFGLSDIVIRNVRGGLTGSRFILVEVAGANEEEVQDLISRQGKFEAKIGNETVFRGGEDIKFVCRSADCSFAVSPRRPCGLSGDGLWGCTFEFSITLSPEAAERQAELTRNLEVVTEGEDDYLSESLSLYLDDELVDTLRIGADLKGKPATEISISGPGFGETQQDAVLDSAKNMKRLQTILKTGSLPVKLDVVKLDSVSPTLGEEFVRNVLFVGFLAILAVTGIVVLRYKDIRIAVPMIITMLSEVILLLGTAAFIGWNLDLAAIAGILIAVGTGVDHQIVIVDEIKQQRRAMIVDWKERIKRAFFIIMAAWATTVVAMFPLLWAGAGLVRGFAITTMLGVTFGVLITRPAFAAVIQILMKE